MKKVIGLLLLFTSALGQERPSRDIAFDLVHTELHLQPHWESSTLRGRAILTLTPHFYFQNHLRLNAREMEVVSIRLGAETLAYTNDGRLLSVPLKQTYKRGDTLRLEISYVAHPEKVQPQPEEENKSEKGLYFINPLGEVKGLQRQLWTQGETQSNSAWFPTLDEPNQNHTQDIYITVEKAFTTLSNGILVRSTDHGNGYKTDHWSQKIPHAVYLTMMAVGDFIKVTDPDFDRFEVSYYMEPEYAPYAQKIFGRTPEMIRFFEGLLGVPYPWEKYAQVAVRKFVSGAMENTSATVHGRFVLKNPHQLVDAHDDAIIAHELFHHWFGNYVTCESWAHLTLNEAFANYAEFLWATHKYGKEEGDMVYLNDLQSYMAEEKRVPLIRFDYANSEDMFDAHSYQKGGRVLHMLRQEVGDEAFFTSLHLYLTANALQTVEVENLRLAFEKVTGRDLKWFFDQWFSGAGHPVVQLERQMQPGVLRLTAVQQGDTGQVFRARLPLRLITSSGQQDTVLVLSKGVETFDLPFEGTFVNYIPNPDGYFLGEIHDDRSVEERIHQYQMSAEIYARLAGLEQALLQSGLEDPMTDSRFRELILSAVEDPFWRIRQWAVQRLNDYDGEAFLQIEKMLEAAIAADPAPMVRADALLAVRNFQNPKHIDLARTAMRDTSYSVRAAALEILLNSGVAERDSLLQLYEGVNDSQIFAVIANHYITVEEKGKLDWVMGRIRLMEGMDLYQYLGLLASYLVMGEAEDLERALPLIRTIALHDPAWYTRMSAVRVLYVVKDLSEEASSAFKEAVASENDERLIRYYQQFDAQR